MDFMACTPPCFILAWLTSVLFYCRYAVGFMVCLLLCGFIMSIMLFFYGLLDWDGSFIVGWATFTGLLFIFQFSCLFVRVLCEPPWTVYLERWHTNTYMQITPQQCGTNSHLNPPINIPGLHTHFNPLTACMCEWQPSEILCHRWKFSWHIQLHVCQ